MLVCDVLYSRIRNEIYEIRKNMSHAKSQENSSNFSTNMFLHYITKNFTAWKKLCRSILIGFPTDIKKRQKIFPDTAPLIFQMIYLKRA